MARYWVDTWTFKKNFKRNLKFFLKNSEKIQKNHELTRGTLLG